MRTRLPVPALGLLLALGACGTDPGPGGQDGRDDLPITQRAIAAVALEHAPTDTTHRQATYTDDTDPQGALGADLRYDGGGEDDGGLLRVFLSPTTEQPEDLCEHADVYGGCEVREVDGGRLVFRWFEAEPEEDPGGVSVTMLRPDETVSAGWSGDTITGDPRDQDLRIPVDVLEAIVRDDRISLTTTQDVLDLGERLDDWSGQEPDPAAYDRVPSTGKGLANAYVLAHGGYALFSRPRPSPLTTAFGPGAIGGRFDHGDDLEIPPSVVDVLAAPGPPPWLEGDPCATPRFAGHCAEESRGRYFLWEPGTRGEVWMIGLRDEETVAVHVAGYDVAEDEETARVQADWYFVERLLTDRTFGLTTQKRVLEFDF